MRDERGGFVESMVCLFIVCGCGHHCDFIELSTSIKAEKYTYFYVDSGESNSGRLYPLSHLGFEKCFVLPLVLGDVSPFSQSSLLLTIKVDATDLLKSHLVSSWVVSSATQSHVPVSPHLET